MVNCNPETVSTDWDSADRLYFEPLTLEEVLDVIQREGAEGAVAQFGGQTPLKLARALAAAGVTILGTPPEAIDLAEDRERFSVVIKRLGLRQPACEAVVTLGEATRAAANLGYPVLVRPSYVLGGRGRKPSTRRRISQTTGGARSLQSPRTRCRSIGSLSARWR